MAVPASATRTYFADKSWLLALALMLVIGVYAYTARRWALLEVVEPECG